MPFWKGMLQAPIPGSIVQAIRPVIDRWATMVKPASKSDREAARDAEALPVPVSGPRLVTTVVNDELLQPPLVGRVHCDVYFQLGVADGYADQGSTAGSAVIEAADSPEQILVHDAQIYKEIVKLEAEGAWLEEKAKADATQLARANDEMLGAKKVLADLLDRRGKRRLELKELQKSLLNRRGLAGWAQRNLGLGPKYSDMPPERPHPLSRLLVGGLLTAVGSLVILADLAISMGAVYLFGYNDEDIAGWTGRFDWNTFTSSWRPFVTCAAIAGITFSFKHIYERLKYRWSKPFHPGEPFVLLVLGLLGSVTLALLAVARADYMVAAGQIPNLPDAHPEVARWATILSMFFFSVLGAVLLSEGLSGLFGGLGGVLGILFNKGDKVAELERYREEETLIQLSDEIINVEKRVSALGKTISELEIVQQKDKQRNIVVQRELKLAQQQSGEIEKALLHQKDLHLALYDHGIGFGRILRTSLGPYALLHEAMTSDLRRDVGGEGRSLSADAARAARTRR